MTRLPILLFLYEEDITSIVFLRTMKSERINTCLALFYVSTAFSIE
jgi:hypothetical protein